MASLLVLSGHLGEYLFKNISVFVEDEGPVPGQCSSSWHWWSLRFSFSGHLDEYLFKDLLVFMGTRALFQALVASFLVVSGHLGEYPFQGFLGARG